MGNENRTVLVALKISEMGGSALCLGCHVYNYLVEDESMSRMTIFSGTYVGFILVSLIFCISQVLEYRPPKGMDFFVCGFAAVMYFICAMLTMYFVKEDEHMEKIDVNEQLQHPFFIASICACSASFFTGLAYTLDSVISYDFWKESIRKQHLLAGDLAKGTPDEDDLGEIQLHCYCFTVASWFGRKCCTRCVSPPIEDPKSGEGPSTRSPGLQRSPGPTLQTPNRTMLNVPNIEITDDSHRQAPQTSAPAMQEPARARMDRQPQLMKHQKTTQRIDEEPQVLKENDITSHQYEVVNLTTNIVGFSADEKKLPVEAEDCIEMNEVLGINRILSETVRSTSES